MKNPLCLSVYVSVLYFSNLLNTIYALKKCDKIDSCSCKLDTGDVFDLKSIAMPSSPKFSDILDKTAAKSYYKYYYNPCNAFTIIDPDSTYNQCENVAVCQKMNDLYYYNLGTQDTAEFSVNSDESVVITYYNGGVKSVLTVKCDSVLTLTGGESSEDYNRNDFELKTPLACFSTGISGGSVLLIVFFTLVLVYIVLGVLVMKFHKGASGIEVVPNISFWKKIPTYIKDGTIFVVKRCKPPADGYSPIE